MNLTQGLFGTDLFELNYKKDLNELTLRLHKCNRIPRTEIDYIIELFDDFISGPLFKRIQRRANQDPKNFSKNKLEIILHENKNPF